LRNNLEEPPISGVTRRTFLLSTLALASEYALAFVKDRRWTTCTAIPAMLINPL